MDKVAVGLLGFVVFAVVFAVVYLLPEVQTDCEPETYQVMTRYGYMDTTRCR
jgi:hypothetical protein